MDPRTRKGVDQISVWFVVVFVLLVGAVTFSVWVQP